MFLSPFFSHLRCLKVQRQGILRVFCPYPLFTSLPTSTPPLPVFSETTKVWSWGTLKTKSYPFSNNWKVLSRSVVSDSLQPCGWSSVRLLCPWGFSRQEHWGGLPCPPTTEKWRAKYHAYFCLFFPHFLQKMLVGVEGDCVMVQVPYKPFLSVPATKRWGGASRLSPLSLHSTALLPDALLLLLSRFPNPLIILHFGWFLSQLPSFAFCLNQISLW